MAPATKRNVVPCASLFRSRTFGELSKVSDVFVIYYSGRPVCGQMCLRDESIGRARTMFSGSVRLESKEDSVLAGRLNRSEEHTSELQSPVNNVCRTPLEKK